MTFVAVRSKPPTCNRLWTTGTLPQRELRGLRCRRHCHCRAVDFLNHHPEPLVALALVVTEVTESVGAGRGAGGALSHRPVIMAG